MLRGELLRLFLCQIRVEVNLVNLPFSVRDAQGRLVKGLTRDDFEVYEDGARQTISHFSQAADTPLALGLVADASGSLCGKTCRRVRQVAGEHEVSGETHFSFRRVRER